MIYYKANLVNLVGCVKSAPTHRRLVDAVCRRGLDAPYRVLSHRKPVTLTEVLISIFLMALGLLALLALFPVGALTMAQAVKDDRTAHLGYTAEAVARFQGLRVDPNVWPAYANPYAPAAPPLGALPDLNNTLPTYFGPSYPVFVDPIGAQAYSATQWGAWVGGMGTPPAVGIPRRGVSFATTLAQIYRWFTLLDDIDFGDNGIPLGAPLSFQRKGEFSWACLCQMNQYSPPPYQPPSGPTTGIKLTVVVYYKRSLDLTTGLTPPGETPYQATVPPNTSRLITLSWNPAAGQDKPAVRKSTWILDATMGNPAANPPQNPHGYFYRVVNVVEPGSAGPNSIDVETQTDVRDSGTLQTIVVMESVAEVFEKGP